jgi:hypothetical protein
MAPRLHLIRENTVPPNGFRYFQPETKVWVRASTLHSLEREVVKHRTANHLPIGSDLAGEIEQQLCEALGPEWCEGPTPASSKTRTAWRAIVQGTTTLVDWAIKGGRKVSADEADQRAAICAKCPENREVNCLPCNAQRLADVMGLFPTEPIPHGKFLKSCAICSCMLEKKVWVPLDILYPHIPESQMQQLPPHCWVKKPELKTA